MPVRAPKRVYHKPPKTPYAYGANPAAIKHAAAKGYSGIDLDLSIAKNKTPVVNHWRQPLKRDRWFDPKGQIPHGRAIDEMPYEEYSRLRYKAPDGQIHPFMSARWAITRKPRCTPGCRYGGPRCGSTHCRAC